MTDDEYVNLTGDSLTKFIPTKRDLEILANALADEVIGHEFIMRFCVGSSIMLQYNQDCFRLRRVMDYLPERVSEINEKLRRGFAKIDVREKQTSEELEAEAQQRSESRDAPPL
jgi:hypothetical protein